MRIYVAGIHFAPEHQKLSTAEKTRMTVEMLKTIHRDAHKRHGEVTVVVLMQEYALNPFLMDGLDDQPCGVSVPLAEVKESVAILREALKSYKDMILVPGSYSSLEEFNDEERRLVKTERVLSNHTLLQSKPNNLGQRVYIVKERRRVENFQSRKTLSNCDLQRNEAYILTAQSKAKRHNSVPYFEEKKLANKGANSFFYIGEANPVRDVKVNGSNVDVGVLMCVEQHIIELHETEHKDGPTFEVVVSDTTTLNRDNLFGAINMQMDSKKGLRVLINFNHCQYKGFSDVSGYLYDTSNLNGPTKEIWVEGYGGQTFAANADAHARMEEVIAEELVPAFGKRI